MTQGESRPERRSTTGATLHRASLRAFDVSERTARAGWRSQQRRVRRWRSRLFMIVQMSVAAGVSWGFARYVLGHQTPFLATVASIVCLGFSFGQRLWRVVEVSVGVTLGVLIGDVFLHFFGTGVWQIMLVIGTAMSVATWLGARTLMASQAAVQAATVMTIVSGTDQGFSRWQDALVGCTVALLFATVAPTSPIDRPRLIAAKVLQEAATTVRATVAAIRASDLDLAEQVLATARATETELSRLLAASHEGMAVVRTSPFLRRHRRSALQVSDLVVPLDRFIRNLRVLARRATVVNYRGEHLPEPLLVLLGGLAQAIDDCATELFARRLPSSQLPELRRLAQESSGIVVEGSFSGIVLLAQVRSMLVDLMELCGEPYTEARDAVPDIA